MEGKDAVDLLIRVPLDELKTDALEALIIALQAEKSKRDARGTLRE